MASEIPTAGYTDLRDHVRNNWDYIELVDDTGSAVLRVSVSGDSRASWTDNGQTQLAEITVSGSDSDITTSVTIAESRLFDVASAGSAYSSDTFANATLSQDTDELTVQHEVQVPQV